MSSGFLVSEVMRTVESRGREGLAGIAPGPFLSEMMEGAERGQPGYQKGAASATLLKRIADCDEIIGTALYLASDASSFLTGEDIKVTGGMQLV